MCSAVRRRMLLNGTDGVALAGPRRRLRSGAAAGAGAAGGAAAAGAAAGVAGAPARPGPAGRAPPVDARRSTSLRVMRPPAPVPVIGGRVEAVLGDQPAHDRRQHAAAAAGAVGRRRRRRGAGSAAGAGSAGAGARLRGGLGCGGRRRPRARPAAGCSARRLGAGCLGRRRGLGGRGARPPALLGAPAPAPPPAGASPITASTVPTSTVSPSGTRISVSVPADRRRHLGVDLVGRHLEQRLVLGDLVADRLNHLVIVPSVTVSPSWGIGCRPSRSLLARRCRTGQPCRPRPVSDEHRLAEELADSVGCGWMKCGDLVDRGLPVDRQVALAELLGDPRADHVHAEDAARRCRRRSSRR